MVPQRGLMLLHCLCWAATFRSASSSTALSLDSSFVSKERPAALTLCAAIDQVSNDRPTSNVWSIYFWRSTICSIAETLVSGSYKRSAFSSAIFLKKLASNLASVSLSMRSFALLFSASCSTLCASVAASIVNWIVSSSASRRMHFRAGRVRYTAHEE